MIGVTVTGRRTAAGYSTDWMCLEKNRQMLAMFRTMHSAADPAERRRF